VGHTAAADFYTNLDNIPTKWNQFSDGQVWKGNWTASGTLYKIGDIVKYGGLVYICNEGHVSRSTLELDQSNWDLFAESLDWKGNWAINTTYKVNDVVKYGGQTYVCSTYHTSAATATLGLEDDQGNWDYFHKGIEFKDTWLNSTRYKVNDLVKYGGSVWRCNTEHTSTSNFDTAKFEIFVGGTEFEQDWSSSTTYQVGDIVRYGGYNYIAKTVHSNQTPSTSTAFDRACVGEHHRCLC
jgi:hypothetical protein